MWTINVKGTGYFTNIAPMARIMGITRQHLTKELKRGRKRFYINGNDYTITEHKNEGYGFMYMSYDTNECSRYFTTLQELAKDLGVTYQAVWYAHNKSDRGSVHKGKIEYLIGEALVGIQL